MVKLENAGEYSPGKRVKPIKDLAYLAKRISLSLFDERYPILGSSYLIDECWDFVPMLLKKNGRDEAVPDERRLFHVRPSLLQFRLKLFGFEMNNDKMGQPYYFNSNLFVPEWYN